LRPSLPRILESVQVRNYSDMSSPAAKSRQSLSSTNENALEFMSIDRHLMTASNQIFLIVDAGTPVAAFTARHELKAFLQRRRDAFTNPLVFYRSN
jgi:mevalonate pyrophosphate decarboxylase